MPRQPPVKNRWSTPPPKAKWTRKQTTKRSHNSNDTPGAPPSRLLAGWGFPFKLVVIVIPSEVEGPGVLLRCPTRSAYPHRSRDLMLYNFRWQMAPSFHYADARGLATCRDLAIKGNQVERIPMPLDAASVSVINRVVGLIGLVAGLTFILGGGFMIHHNHLDQFLLNPAVAEGQVVENKSKQNYPGTGSRILPFTSYQAIVQFTDQQNQTVTYRDTFGFNPPSFQVGQSVRIFYDPQIPQRA